MVNIVLLNYAENTVNATTRLFFKEAQIQDACGLKCLKSKKHICNMPYNV